MANEEQNHVLLPDITTEENCISINAGTDKYECYLRLNDQTDIDASYINKRLEWIRKSISQLNFSRRINIYVDIRCYLSEEVNAFAKKISDRVFLIAVSSKLISGFRDELATFFRDNDFRKRFEGHKKSILQYVSIISECISFYVVLHELFHILNGHLCAKGAHEIGYMAEKDRTDDKKYRQILECDADFCAMRSCTYIVLERFKNTDERLMALKYLGFSVYFFFLQFQKYGSVKNIISTDFYMNDHPFASIRYVYAILPLIMCVNSIFERNKCVDVVRDIIDNCIYFDRVFYDSDTFDMSLVSLAYTKKGLGHMKTLHTEWNKVAKDLKDKAFVELKHNEDVDFESMVWVNSQGQMIQSKIAETIWSLSKNNMILKW